jgi:hypothetical protein
MLKKRGGRPKGSGTYGEDTVPVRVPKSKLQIILDLLKQWVIKEDKDEKAQAD